MNLNYKTFGEGFPLIILHGLLGSLDNWQSLAKKFSSHFKVYIIDQRNHGKSPHSADFNYTLLAQDLLDFFKEHNIANAHIIGHSMGGKTAMKFALTHPEKVSKLIVVDIAPSGYADGHTHIFKALLDANVAHAQTREQVELFLRDNLKEDESTIQFLMKGLTRPVTSASDFEWKFNIESLIANYKFISGAVESDKPFEGPTLFIKGEKSNYINASNYQSINSLFPANELSEVKGAGHWVHAEKPDEFAVEVMKFLS